MRACENPFRSERLLQIRYQLQGTTWEDLLARWQGLGQCGAIIGPHGTGKTTLLESLEPRLQEQGFDTRFVRLNAEYRKLESGLLNQLCADLTPKAVVLVDGAEQMNALAWRRFCWQTRRAGGLLITTHEAGWLPTIWECRTSAALLAEIAARLLAVDQELVRERAEKLFQKHRGNLRDALREWYDLVAG